MNYNDIIKKAQDLLGIDYNDVYEIIDNLCSEIDRLNEQIDDIEEKHQEEIRDYFKPKSMYEICGVNEKDF